MSALPRFTAELRKLVLLLRADPRAVAAGVIAPTAILLVFWITFGNMSSLEIAVVNHDAGRLGARLEHHILAQTSPAGGRPYFTSRTGDEQEALELYERGQIAGVVVIGEDFTRRVEDRGSPAVEFHVNNYSADMAKNLRLYLQEGIVSFYDAEYPGYDLQVDEEYTVDSQVDWFELIAAGIFMLAFLIGSMFSLLSLLFAEKTLGTAAEYALSPAGPWPFWCARLLFSLLLGALTAAFNGVLIRVVCGLNVAAFLLPALVPLVLITGIWMAVATILALSVRQFAGAAVGAMVAAVLCWFLGGGTSPARYLAGPERVLAEAIPNTWALGLIRSRAFGYPVDDAGASYGLLAVVCAILLATATLMYHRRFARRRPGGRG